LLRCVAASGVLERSPDAVDRALEHVEDRETARLKRGLTVLKVLAGVAAILGAVGSGDGVVRRSWGQAFAEPALREALLARVLAESWQPMFFGCAVAAVALIGHAILSRIVEARVARLAQDRALARAAFAALRAPS
jgi:hypothetical protein